MTVSNVNPESTDVAAAPEPMRWVIRLWEDRPERRYAVLAVSLAAGSVGWFMMSSPIFAVIGIFAILGSTTEFWLPIRYVLDQKGASHRCGISVSAIEWSDVKRVIVSGNMIRLSPLEKEGRMDPFRGISLRCGENTQDVLKFVEERIGEGCSISGMTS